MMMAQLFFLNSNKTAAELLPDTPTLIDEILLLIGFESDEEYLALSGILSAIVTKDGINKPYSGISVHNQMEDGSEHAYLEVDLDGDQVSQLPPGMVARFDQLASETFDEYY